MDTSTPTQSDIATSDLEMPEAGDKPANPFFPTGAIAFFIALVILCLAIWFGIYFIMIERA